jgi:hypothetical protein
MSAPKYLLLATAVTAALSLSACGSAATGSGSSPAAATASPIGGAATDVSGVVSQVYSTGDFVLNAGALRFTVMMSPTTTVLNIRGRQVPRQFISVSGPAEVTGKVSGSTIAAETIRLPTRKDGS